MVVGNSPQQKHADVKDVFILKLQVKHGSWDTVGGSWTSFANSLNVFIKHLLRRNIKLTRYNGAGGGEDVVDAGDERGVVQLTSLGEKPEAIKQTQVNSESLWTCRLAADVFRRSCHSLSLEDHWSHHAHEHDAEDRVVELHVALDGEEQHACDGLHCDDCNRAWAPVGSKRSILCTLNIVTGWTDEAALNVNDLPSRATSRRMTTR